MCSLKALIEVGHHTKSHHSPSLHPLHMDSQKCNPAYACPPPWEQFPGKTLLKSPTTRYFGEPLYGTLPGNTNILLKPPQPCLSHHQTWFPHFLWTCCHAAKIGAPEGGAQGGSQEHKSSMLVPSPPHMGATSCIPSSLPCTLAPCPTLLTYGRHGGKHNTVTWVPKLQNIYQPFFMEMQHPEFYLW